MGKDYIKRNSNHSGGNKKGFYIVLIMCLAAFVITGGIVLMTGNQAGKKMLNNEKNKPTETGGVMNELDHIFATPKPTVKPSAKPTQTNSQGITDKKTEPTPTMTPLATPTPKPERKTVEANVEPFEEGNTGDNSEMVSTKPAVFSMPVENGEIIENFSGEQLVYSKTFEDWRTHTGVDIAAPKGTAVMAVSDGRITKIYDDPLWGTVIEIDHSGFVSKYANLTNSLIVKEGQKVKGGDIISGVGDTAVCESQQEMHLHFEVLVDGKPVDPGKYIQQ